LRRARSPSSFRSRTKNDEIVTAYDMKAIDKMGLLKMDFLGLTTLTVITDASSSSKQNRGEKSTSMLIPLDDPETSRRSSIRAHFGRLSV
jgi:DNA polymerase-3 subunit alpha